MDLITDQHYSREEIIAIVQEAKLVGGTMVCAHSEELEATRVCVEAGVDSIEHGQDLDEKLADNMVQKDVYLVPTMNLIVNWYGDFMNPDEELSPSVELGPFFQRNCWDATNTQSELEKAIDNFNMAREKGVKIALGSDSLDSKITPYGWYSAMELKCMVDHGMSPLEGITAATRTAAEVLGLGNRIGTIEPGKIADMILVQGNPADNIDILVDSENIKYVIKEGQLTVDHGRLTY